MALCTYSSRRRIGGDDPWWDMEAAGGNFYHRPAYTVATAMVAAERPDNDLTDRRSQLHSSDTADQDPAAAAN
jgi:hypothetical protein